MLSGLRRCGTEGSRADGKEKGEPKPICYCKNVTEAGIPAHIRAGCCHTLEDIQRHTGANTGKQCAVKNPTGR